MRKIIFAILLMFISSLQTQAFEDCIISTKARLTDISIEDNSIVNVYPLITLYNKKNMLIVEPLKEGKTRFCVLKNDKEKTTIDEVKGFIIQTIDIPESDEFELDEPPTKLGGQ